MGIFSASWKTSLGGFIAALGGVLMQVKDPAWMAQLGALLVPLGTAIVGMTARDDSVTSEKAGAVKPPAQP